MSIFRKFSPAVNDPDVKRRLARSLDKIMVDISADVFVLCNVVAHGRKQWRLTFLNAMHEAGLGAHVDVDVADRIFLFFSIQVLKRAGKLGAGDDVALAQEIAGTLLDKVEIHEPRVPSEREIAESWVIESGSSPEGQRFIYGGQTRDEVMQQFKGDILSTLRDIPEV